MINTNNYIKALQEQYDNSHYSSKFINSSSTNEDNWFSKNENIIRKQLILFCSTPFFKKYKKTNPSLYNHIYNISKLINYGVGNLDDLENLDNKPFLNILKHGFVKTQLNIFKLNILVDNDESIYDTQKHTTYIFKHSKIAFLFLLDHLICKEQRCKNLILANQQILKFYQNKFSPIQKIIHKFQNNSVFYFKTHNIDIQTAIDYSEDLIAINSLTNINLEDKNIINKSLCLTNFFLNKIKDINCKEIIQNTFNYNNTKENILKTDPDFYFTMMFYILTPTSFNPSILYSLKNVFTQNHHENIEDIGEKYKSSITFGFNNLINQYFSIKNKNMNEDINEMINLEKRLNKALGVNVSNKDISIENYCSKWQETSRMFLESPYSFIREANLRASIVEKDFTHIKNKI